MGRAEREKDQFRRAKLRLRRIQHYETDHLQNPQASSCATRILQALSPRASPPARARSCRPVCASRVLKIYAQSSIPNAMRAITL